MQCFSITKTEILDQENVSLLYKIYCIPKKNVQYRHQSQHLYRMQDLKLLQKDINFMIWRYDSVIKNTCYSED